MLIRIITGIILIAAVLAWLFVADYPIFALGALFMYSVGAWEMGPLLGFKKRITFLCISVVASTIVFMTAEPGHFIDQPVPSAIKWLISSGMVVWIFSMPLLVRYPKCDCWKNNRILTTVYGLFLLLPFLEGLLVLRATDYLQDPKSGAFLVLAVMALVWCADSGAYFTGRAIGKTKLIPRVSPKKTVEGLCGGILLALIAMLIFVRMGWFASYGENLTNIIIASFFTILFSVEGDLVESMLKRMVGVKDSGRIFPGHGGMLDRIDSQLAAIPVFLFFSFLLNGELF
ncbi:MAG: phosphatidate cytidylyltransferase [Succinivibrio sp.]|nr:phosphatidate cytidylyltransferase [Succinivibrio sp.]